MKRAYEKKKLLSVQLNHVVYAELERLQAELKKTKRAVIETAILSLSQKEGGNQD